MCSRLIEIFEDEECCSRIQERLPLLFQIAEIECTRGKRVGMEVGVVRERILIALLIYKFGEENIEVQTTTYPEVDIRLFGEAVSVKTAKMPSQRKLGAVKLKWTVNGIKANEFLNNYSPSCDLLMAQIRWNKSAGGLYYIPKEVQEKVFEDIGREEYIKLPKSGTNPRGIELTSEALSRMVQDNRVRHLPISWRKRRTTYNPYQRWRKCWEARRLRSP